MKYDIIIVGAGIVGLATAYKLKQLNSDLKILLLEKENEVSFHQTGNNSGVIHSGIYYKPGSLKAKNCIKGYRQLLDFCDENNVQYDLCGKIILASNESEIPALDNLYERGLQNGLTKNKLLKAEEIKEYEPYVKGIKGIFLPYTGIIDYKEVSLKIKELFIQSYGGVVGLNEKVINISRYSDEIIVTTENGEYMTSQLINTAGLYSDQIASYTTQKLNVRIIPFRGEYYKLTPESEYLVKSLIYPVPDPKFPFLGVHFTRLIHGGVEAGPNAVFAFRKEGYKKSDINWKEFYESLSWPGFQKIMLRYTRMGLGEYYRSYNKTAFTKALNKLLPELKKEDLLPGGSGVRAQACDRKGNLIDDFLFIEDDRIINVLNAPSPAATASFSIGVTIAGKAIEKLKT